MLPRLDKREYIKYAFAFILLVIFWSFLFSFTEDNLLTPNRIFLMNKGTFISEEKTFTSPNVHIFYYSWYQNPSFDGKYAHWNHEILQSYPKGVSPIKYSAEDGDIGSDFIPSLGLYSSKDPLVIKKHFEWMTISHIGVCVVSWNGRPGSGKPETQDVRTDTTIPLLLSIAESFDIKIAFQIEPYEGKRDYSILFHYNMKKKEIIFHIFKGRNALSVREDISYIIEAYSPSKAFYLHNGKPLFYVYDSYLIHNWDIILLPNTPNTIRGTIYDSFMIGLVVHHDDARKLSIAGFDGMYTYFATDRFTYGSTYRNWDFLYKFAEEKGILFIPCVGPGYSDLRIRIRPWNIVNQRDRDNGTYYKNYWKYVKKGGIVAITSFNEWHEGTQIEPAAEKKKINGFQYKDYLPNSEYYYLSLSEELISKWLE